MAGEAVEVLSGRKGWGEALRLLQVPQGGLDDQQYRTIGGGLLVQNEYIFVSMLSLSIVTTLLKPKFPKAIAAPALDF